MGCDIHAYVEVKRDGIWVLTEEDVISNRAYGLFGFLADVRNYSHCQPISPVKGLPKDVSKQVQGLSDYWDCDGHSHSWLSLKELLDFDYSQMLWDRRVTKKVGANCWNGAALADEGEGQHLTYKEFLGKWFFDILENLEAYGEPEDVRLVFWFDN
jgi:hypothetical protein